MTILSTQERKYEIKTFNGNFAKKVRICRAVPGNAKLKLPNLKVSNERFARAGKA